MIKRSSDILFQLIHALGKAEKRHFKLFIKRNSSNDNLKIIQLFDAIDKLNEYDESKLLKKLPTVQKTQLSNLKAHLYKQVLASLRLLKSTDSIDLQLNEQFDYAHILYKKGLFMQSLKLLERSKEVAKANQKFTFLIQAIALEKRIETLHITRSMQDRADSLSLEAIEVSDHINMVTRLSNLAIQLYSWYIKNGHAINREEEIKIETFFNDHLPAGSFDQKGFYETLYLCQSLCWLSFIKQDFLKYYRYSQKWVDLFESKPLMKRVETGHYIKGLHNLLNAHFDLRNYKPFVSTLQQLELFAKQDRVVDNENFRIQSFLYLTQAKINLHFLQGTFKEGLALIPGIEENLSTYNLFVDPHRVIVLNYKIAALYFGSGDYSTCIDYLQKIINDNIGLRYDLQCYARLLYLLAHYELKNFELLEHLSRSVYRYMTRMKSLTLLEIEIIKFLRRSFFIAPHQMVPQLKIFLERIKGFGTDRYQTRVFAYIDIISWVESKVYHKPLSTIMNEKYATSKRNLKEPAGYAMTC